MQGTSSWFAALEPWKSFATCSILLAGLDWSSLAWGSCRGAAAPHPSLLPSIHPSGRCGAGGVCQQPHPLAPDRAGSADSGLSCSLPGQSGLGKSTLINTLFKSKISRKSVQPTAEERIPKTIEIKSITHGEALQVPPAALALGPALPCVSGDSQSFGPP